MMLHHMCAAPHREQRARPSVGAAAPLRAPARADARYCPGLDSARQPEPQSRSRWAAAALHARAPAGRPRRAARASARPRPPAPPRPTCACACGTRCRPPPRRAAAARRGPRAPRPPPPPWPPPPPGAAPRAGAPGQALGRAVHSLLSFLSLRILSIGCNSIGGCRAAPHPRPVLRAPLLCALTPRRPRPQTPLGACAKAKPPCMRHAPRAPTLWRALSPSAGRLGQSCRVMSQRRRNAGAGTALVHRVT